MPRELLTRLDLTTERLLFAGAQVAHGDGELASCREQLAPLAARAPAIARIVEQAQKVRQTRGRAAAAELLNLSALMAQVRGAQAPPGAAAGALTPPPPAVPLESPLGPIELTALVDALARTSGGSRRPRLLAEAVERSAVQDLRLLPFCVPALGDPGIADAVERKLLPALGEAIAPELLASLDLRSGKAVDARKLRALAAIRQRAARPLLHEALEKGSAEVRSAALTALAGIDPAEAEPIALRLLSADRSEPVRVAAAEALGACATDGALDALLAAFATSGKGPLRDAAGASLARLSHPRTAERLLTLLTPDLLALAPSEESPGGGTPKQRRAAEEAWAVHQAKVESLGALLAVLGGRKEREALQALIGVLRSHQDPASRGHAAHALVERGEAAALEALATEVLTSPDLLSAWFPRAAFIERCLAQEPDRAFGLLGPFLDPGVLSKAGDSLLYFAKSLLESLYHAAEEEAPAPAGRDPRWGKAAVRLLDHGSLAGTALNLLTRLHSDEAFEAVLAMASAQPHPSHAWWMLKILSPRRDLRVAPVLIRFLDVLKEPWARLDLLQAIRAFDDVALAAPLEAWVSRYKKRLDPREREELDQLLPFLRRERTQASTNTRR